MKPHEETWTADGGYVMRNGEQMVKRQDPPVAQLIAAAPDLVRALLAVEWSAEGYDGYGGVCPDCGQRTAHHPECAIDVALRKAGVR